jgi:hypothetical protein
LIIRTPSVWAVWIAAFGCFFATNIVILYSPTYLHKVIHFEIEKTGFTAALPPLLQVIFTNFYSDNVLILYFFSIFVKLIAGSTSDRIHFLSEQTKVLAFNSVSLGGAAICFACLALIPPVHSTLSLCVLIGKIYYFNN